MIFGISGAPIPIALKYAEPLQKASGEAFPPCLLYAVAYRESISGELGGLWPSALTVVASDNGRGICQVTPADWWPANLEAAFAAIDWQDPEQNAAFAVKWFLDPAIDFWNDEQGFTGTALIRLVADEYNEGRAAAERYHAQGNADLGTTGSDYGAAVLGYYQNLITRGIPT